MMNGLTISASRKFVNRIISQNTYIGTGALLYFTQDNNTDIHTVMIKNSLVTENSGSISTRHILQFHHKSILSAVGLTVLYAQINYPATVSVLKLILPKIKVPYCTFFITKLVMVQQYLIRLALYLMQHQIWHYL